MKCFDFEIDEDLRQEIHEKIDFFGFDLLNKNEQDFIFNKIDTKTYINRMKLNDKFDHRYTWCRQNVSCH